MKWPRQNVFRLDSGRSIWNNWHMCLFNSAFPLACIKNKNGSRMLTWVTQKMERLQRFYNSLIISCSNWTWNPYCLCADIQDDPDIKVMMEGSTLRKVKSRSWKKQRHFRLLEDGLTIWYKSRWAGKGHSTCEFKYSSLHVWLYWFINIKQTML